MVSRDLSIARLVLLTYLLDSDLSVLLGVLGNVQDLKHKTCDVVGFVPASSLASFGLAIPS